MSIPFFSRAAGLFACGMWAVCAWMCLPLSGRAADAPRAPQTPLNVLLITADDLNTFLGCYRHPEVKTPNIDQLAGRALVFDRAYCQQSLSNATRASFLTGVRPDTLKIWDLHARLREVYPNAVTLPEYFKAHGYDTRAIGKIFHNEDKTPPGHVPMYDPASWSQPPTRAEAYHWQDWPDPKQPNGPPGKQTPTGAFAVEDAAFFDGKIADEAVQALASLKAKGQPFFLAVGFWKPHMPFTAPQKYWDMYTRDAIGAPGNPLPPVGSPAIAQHDNPEPRAYQGMPKTGAFSSEQAAQMRHGYFAGVSFLDAQVGRLLEGLERLGLADRTLVVFLGDEGYHLGEQGLWCKGSNYELGLRVPLMIALPGSLSQGRRTQALVELVDLFPTLAQLAGLPPPTSTQGESFARLFNDPSQPGRASTLSENPRPAYKKSWTVMGYSLRTERYRYIEWRNRADGAVVGAELYDFADGGVETRNIADDPACAAVKKQLAQQLAQRVPPAAIP